MFQTLHLLNQIHMNIVTKNHVLKLYMDRAKNQNLSNQIILPTKILSHTRVRVCIPKIYIYICTSLKQK